MKAKNYIRYLVPSSLFGTQRTKQIVNVNPTLQTHRQDAKEDVVPIFDYNEKELREAKVKTVDESFSCYGNAHISWINIDGLIKEHVEKIAAHFGIHPLITEDILSTGQRPKMDEVEGIFYCLLNMLYYNSDGGCVETEQISIVLGKDFVITFQEDPKRDVFNSIRDKLHMPNSKVRTRSADYLCSPCWM